MNRFLKISLVIAVFCGLGIAAWQVRDNRHEQQTIAELSELSIAVEAFKDHFGEYPPDYTSQREVDAFVSRVWPNYMPRAHVGYKPASALVLWLSGLADNETDPFTAVGPRLVFFKFEESRLRLDANSHSIYLPPGSSRTPYYYLNHLTYDWAHELQNATANNAVPYRADSGGWVNPVTFQLIAAGPDDRFGFPAAGARKHYPSGQNYSLFGEDDDNLTSFAGGRLGETWHNSIAGRKPRTALP